MEPSPKKKVMKTQLSAYMTPKELRAKEIERKVRELNEEYSRLQNGKPLAQHKVLQLAKSETDYSALKAEISDFIKCYKM